ANAPRAWPTSWFALSPRWVVSFRASSPPTPCEPCSVEPLARLAASVPGGCERGQEEWSATTCRTRRDQGARDEHRRAYATTRDVRRHERLGRGAHGVRMRRRRSSRRS